MATWRQLKRDIDALEEFVEAAETRITIQTRFAKPGEPAWPGVVFDDIEGILYVQLRWPEELGAEPVGDTGRD